MKKNVTLDNQVKDAWQKAFRLNYDWGEKVPSILAATLALSTLAAAVPSGYYLAKQKLRVRCLPSLNQELILRSEITKKNISRANCIMCQASVVHMNETMINLESVLLKLKTGPPAHKTPKTETPKTETVYLGDPEYRHTFSIDEVNAFSLLSGDINDIHSGVNPVVQGMLILLTLEDCLAFNNYFFKDVDVFYLQPVRTDNPVRIYRDSQNLYGMMNENICFKLNFPEDYDDSKSGT